MRAIDLALANRGRAAALLLRALGIAATAAAIIIVIGILFVVLGGNPDNTLVDASTDAAKFLVGPFDELFKPDNRKLGVAVSWGSAAIVYFVLSRIAARAQNPA